MAIVVEQFGGTKATSSAATASHTASPSITTGRFVICTGGFYYKGTSNTIDITVPAGTTSAVEESTVTFDTFMDTHYLASWGAGSGDIITITNSASDKKGVAGYIELSGASALDVVASTDGSISQSKSSGTTASVASNGSLAIAIFCRERTAAGNPSSFSYSNDFEELFKVTGGGSSTTDLLVATLQVDAGATPSTVISHTGTTSSIVGSIVVISSATATAPSITDPGDNTIAAIGVAEDIGTTVTITDGTTVTCAVSCTEALGDIDCMLAGVTTVSVGSKPSHTFTLSSTSLPNMVTTIGSLTYTPTAAGTDSAVTISIDDGVNTAVANTIVVTNFVGTVTASTEADLNLALATLTATNSVVETATLTVKAFDVGQRTGTDTANVVTTAQSFDFMDRGPRRRRRQKDKTWWRQEQ